MEFLGEEPVTRSSSDQEAFSLDSLLNVDALYVDRELATSLGVIQGDSVIVHVGLHRFEAIVRGVLTLHDGQWDSTAIMDIAAAQVQLRRLGQLDGVDLGTTPGTSVDRVMQELQARLGPSVLVTRLSQQNGQVQQMLTSFQLNLAAFSTVGLFVGVFLVCNAVGFSVVHHRRAIGILRAIGMLRRHIGLLFLGEAMMVGAAAGALGSVVGSGLAQSLATLEQAIVSELYGIETPGKRSFSLPVLWEGAYWERRCPWWGHWGRVGKPVRLAPARAIAFGQYEPTRHHHGQSTVLALGVLGVAWLLSWPGPVHGLHLFGYDAAFCVLLGCTLLAPLAIHLLSLATFPRLKMPVFDVSSMTTVGERLNRRSGTGFNPSSASMTRLAVDQIAKASSRNSVTLAAFMVGIAIVVGVGVIVESFRDTVERYID